MSDNGKDHIAVVTISGTESLRAPVVPVPGETGVRLMQSYIARLRGIDVAHIAGYEAERLSPYMNAFATRLNAAHENAPEQPRFKRSVIDYHRLGGWDADAQTLYDRKQVSGLFNKMAADTGNVLLSEVGIVSADVLSALEASDEKQNGDMQFFSKRTEISGYGYQLGFVQFPKRQEDASIAFPLMALDKRIIERLTPDVADDLLDSLSQMATAGNHDVLHHLTSTVINGNISGSRTAPDYAPALNIFLNSYLTFNDDLADSYEGWALVSHTQTWREMRGSAAERDLRQQADRYFDALERLDTTLVVDNVPDSVRYKVTDYLSTIAAHALMRFLPVNDPLMDHVLTRMERLASSDDATLTQYMRERWRNPQTQYPEHADLKSLQKLYLKLLERPGFMNEHTQGDLKSALSQNVRYELEKPDYDRDPRLKGAGSVSSDDFPRYAKALGSVRFDETIVDDESIPAGRRAFVLNEMRKTRLMTVTSLFKSVQSYLHRHASDPDFEQNIHQLGLIHFDGLRRNAAKAKQEDNAVGLAYQTARNYKAAGYDILGAEGSAPDWRHIKMWDMVRAMPIIAYLASPDVRDERLAHMHRLSRTVDRGVVNITGGGLNPS